MTTESFLRKPYARRLIPDEDGGYVATIQEFPGCITDGDTAEEALCRLEIVAEGWINAKRAKGESIPEPISFHGYSGKIALRIPRGIHKQAAELAVAEDVSLNQLLLGAIANYVGERNALRESLQLFSKRMHEFDFLIFSTVQSSFNARSVNEVPITENRITPINFQKLPSLLRIGGQSNA